MKSFFKYLKQIISGKNKEIEPKIENIIEPIGESSTIERIDENTVKQTIQFKNNIKSEITQEIKKEESKKEEPIKEEETKYNGTVILLDNGHAKTTPGKRSPIFDDGKTQFFEYEFSRDIVRRISEELEKLGIKYYILVPEVNNDIVLTTRAARANEYCDKYGKDNCLFISIHSNASGKGEWKKVRGWSVWTSKGNTKSDEIATIFYEEAEKILPKYKMTLRKDMSDGDPDYEDNFTVLKKTKCKAILTENLFQDNKVDAKFLMSEEGRKAITDIHVNAIKRICNIK